MQKTSCKYKNAQSCCRTTLGVEKREVTRGSFRLNRRCCLILTSGRIRFPENPPHRYHPQKMIRAIQCFLLYRSYHIRRMDSAADHLRLI